MGAHFHAIPTSCKNSAVLKFQVCWFHISHTEEYFPRFLLLCTIDVNIVFSKLIIQVGSLLNQFLLYFTSLFLPIDLIIFSKCTCHLEVL